MTRVLTGAVLIPVVLLVVLWGSPELLMVGLLALALPACLELGRMLGARRRALQPATATLAVWVLIVLFLLRAPAPLAVAGLIPLIAAGVALFALREATAAADAVLSTCLCALWVGVGLGSLLGLRVAAGDPAQGRLLLLFCLLVIWASDIAAYYGGKRFGRRRLSWVSPGKTWEGSGFGLAGGLAAAAAVSSWVPGLDLPHALGMGATVTLAGMIGDLAESVQKRAAGLKDSGSLLPGHGGVLDRVDSLLFAGPAAYVYAYLALW